MNIVASVGDVLSCKSHTEALKQKLDATLTAAPVLHAALVIKIQEAGSKDDIKVPLRVLRDEIGRAFFAG